MDIHLVPPHNHRVNTTKCAIATFKEHFISALATVDRNCPLQLWEDFLPQVEPTLNLLQFSQRINKEVNGKFNYNKMPLATWGTKGLVYNNPAIRASWALYGTDAYYVGPAINITYAYDSICPVPDNIGWPTGSNYVKHNAPHQHCHQQSKQYYKQRTMPLPLEALSQFPPTQALQ
jgi:hypothetical protein